MRGVQYIRVSDEEQAIEGYSIQAQKALLDRKFAEWGAQVVGVYIDDGYSAKHMRRPDLQRLLKDIETIRPDFIAFWKLDRWTRSDRDWHALQDILDKYNVELRSAIGENLKGTTAFERFNVGLNVLLGQFEREQISERVHFVMMERHQKGLRNGAKPPYGYDLIDGKLIVNPEQAKVVKRIFDMYINKLAGFREIAVTLNRDPNKPDDKIWNYSTVRYTLMNPVYCGKLRWNYRKSNGKRTGKEVITDGDHEPIIDEALFQKVYKEISARVKGGKTVSSAYAFSGILRCARCGYAMTGFSAQKSNGRQRYYRCTGRSQYGICNMPIVTDKKVQEAFLNALNYDSEQLKKLFDVSIDDSINERKKRLDSLKKELKQIKSRKKKWQLAFANDAITVEELKERTKEDTERESEIIKEIQAIPDESSNGLTSEEIISRLSRVRDLWERTDDEKAKKLFIREIFESITIDSDTERAHGAPGKFVEVTVTDFKLLI